MPFQLALDEILFTHHDHVFPVLRFYFSSEPWITVGYSYPSPLPVPARQMAGRRQAGSPLPKGEGIQNNSFSQKGVGVQNNSPLPFGERTKVRGICKRMTGGGQVQHGDDLIFSLIARKSDDDSFGSVRKSYWKIHEAVKMGMELCGTTTRFYRCDEKLERGGDCFRFPIATDLAIGTKKVAGGAQKRSAGLMLHQESIQCLPGVDTGQLSSAICIGFEKIFQIKISARDLDPVLLEQAKDLSRRKYERNEFSPIGIRPYERAAEFSTKN